MIGNFVSGRFSLRFGSEKLIGIGLTGSVFVVLITVAFPLPTQLPTPRPTPRWPPAFIVLMPACVICADPGCRLCGPRASA